MKTAIEPGKRLPQFEALTAFNKPVFESYAAIQQILARQQDPLLSALFSEPVETGGQLLWLTDLPGPFRPWSALGINQRTAPEAERARLTQKLATLLEHLSADGINTRRGNMAHLLRAATVIPSLDHLYVAGDHLVLTHWGFRRPGEPGVAAFGETPPLVEPVRSAGSPAPAAKSLVTEPRPRRRLIWLLLPLLLAVATCVAWLILTAPIRVSPQRTEAAAQGFGSTTYAPDALRGNIYFLPTGTSHLPDLKTLQPVGTLYSRTLDVPSRNFTSGFPGITNRFEWFAIRYTGTLHVPADAAYGFRIVSDDGAKVSIDDKLLIDNDGLHGALSRSGTAMLTKGSHMIAIDYFQGPRTALALEFFCTAQGMPEHLFPECGLNLTTENASRWVLHVSFGHLWARVHRWLSPLPHEQSP